MKLHSRTMQVQAAEAELHGWLVGWEQRHGLTTLEALACLHAAGQRITKYALRAERHPDDPDRGADEADTEFEDPHADVARDFQ